MKKWRTWLIVVLFTVTLLVDLVLIRYCNNFAKLNQMLGEDALDILRAQEVSLEQLEQFREWEKDEDGFSCYEYLCAGMMTDETSRDSLEWYIRQLKEYREEDFLVYTGYLESVWSDLVWFPVPISTLNQDADITFSDSWMHLRTFGGERGHEGTDIMAQINERGRYPVVSMTDGVIEKTGWLTQGGYRLGIRASHGSYFYYAHLYDYAKEFQPGDKVQAGELIGFMGDSGYSEIPGTVGNFDVHLHLGIYVNQPDGTEISINSFWLLKYLEGCRLNYKFY